MPCSPKLMGRSSRIPSGRYSCSPLRMRSQVNSLARWAHTTGKGGPPQDTDPPASKPSPGPRDTVFCTRATSGVNATSRALVTASGSALTRHLQWGPPGRHHSHVTPKNKRTQTQSSRHPQPRQVLLPADPVTAWSVGETCEPLAQICEPRPCALHPPA